MKQLYFLILLSFFSCAEKTKEKKETIEATIKDTIQIAEQLSILKEENASKNRITYNGEDISGEYELIYGKTHIIGDENYESYKAAIVIEKLSETDFGFYSADKTKDISPIGDYGVLRRMNNRFHELKICDGEDVEGYSEGNFTSGPYLFNQVVVYKKGDVLGMIQYGGNFRKYMLYTKKKSNADFYISLIKTMKDTKQEYQEYLKAYETSKNHNTTKLEVRHYLNDDVWITKHLHDENYASFEKTHFYQNPLQEGKFIKHDEAFVNQFKNQVENGTFDKEALANEAFEKLNFEDVIHSMAVRPLPRIENTTFDDFIEAEDYENASIKTLQLEKLYSGFNEKDSGFRAINCYRLEISKRFHSVVVTILKGDHEMESVLINYDLNGEILASKVVSYDEITEGQSRIESRINENMIKTDHIFWDVMKEVKQEEFRVNQDGTIEKMSSVDLSRTLTNYPLILDVLEQLKLNLLDVKTDLIVSKAMFQNSDDTIIVIPEIENIEEQEFELNSYIVLVNNDTGKISHQYFESATTNNWVSDAIQLKEVKIDTAQYIIAENARAFGVRVRYYGHSQANPYNNETISLFTKYDNTLKKVLNNYDVMNYGGEWDTNCSGEFIGSEVTMEMSTEKTSEHFDILVKNTITETKNYEDEDGDCQSKDEIKVEKTVLKFKSNEYKTQGNIKDTKSDKK